MPLFSVVTAVFNDANGLQRTAASLRSQSCRDFEWIVVDGGSTDGTVEFLRRCEAAPEWSSEPDEGIADAWNKGIRKSQGQLVVILNAGDTFDENYLETMKNAAVDNRIICCAVRIAQPDGTLAGVMEAAPEKLWRGMHIPHNWCVVPRSLYQQLGDYPKRKYAMDFIWFHRYFLRFGAEGFIVVPKILGTYHMGGHSDLGYRSAFAEVEQILREGGMNRVLARILRVGYTLKHGAVHRLGLHFARSRRTQE